MQPVSAMRCSICCKMEKQKPYFPMFVDLSEKQILCIGGGTIAARRIQTLTKFTDHLIVLAPEICEERGELLDQFPITWIRRKLKPEDMIVFERGVSEEEDAAKIESIEEPAFHNSYMVLAATDDHELNHAVVKACKKRGILVNTCDDKSQCDYYFPAVTEVDGVMIGLNSGGKDPKKVSRVRQQIEKSVKY